MKSLAVQFARLRNQARLILAGFVLLVGGAARAADYDIFVTEDGFDPNYLVVQLGDTVYWDNDDSFFDDHSCQSFDYPWNSGPIPWGFAFMLTVTKVGSFSYID